MKIYILISLLVTILIELLIQSNGNVIPVDESNKQQNGPYPIILVPGDGGSQLFAKLDKPKVVHYCCDRRTNDYFNLWLNAALLAPLAVDCWIDNMRLVYDNVTRKTLNSPGVDIIAPGFGNTTTVEYVDPSNLSVTGYYNQLVAFFVANGFRRGIDIRGAPYDFRRSPPELTDYYGNITALVEDTYRINGNKKVIIVCHSMGCPVMLYYLNGRSQNWKDKYIKSFVTLASPWGGAVKALKAFISGDNFGFTFVPTLTIRKEERTYSSLAYLMPSEKFWPKDEVIISRPTKNYTSTNYKELFNDINYNVGYEMWIDTKNLTDQLIHPGTEVHCIHGSSIATTEKLEYRDNEFPDRSPKIISGNGDSTVNIRSLAGCTKWKKQNNKWPFFYQNYPGIDHMGVMSDRRILEYILALAKNY